jgi:arylsulfatase A-like enzyme
VKRGRVVAAALVLLLAGAGTAILLHRAPAARLPHIVIFLWDTTRADHLSACGYRRETTPWLRKVASEGVLFEQCRTPAPWTVPAHASLFTGLLPAHHGSVDIYKPLAAAHETLAERLAKRGYDTVLVSNNEFVGPPEIGLGQGFARIRMVMQETGRPPSVRDTLTILTDELDLRRRDPDRADRPLFLFVNLMEPHLPYTPTPSVERAWRPEGVKESEVNELHDFKFPLDVLHNMGVPGYVLSAHQLSILPGLYDGEIRDMDAGCADLEGRLAEEGILGPGADCLFVVTADHGESLGEHGLVDHKFSCGDWLLHVPLVIRRPGRFEGGGRVAAQVRLQDLFPTLLDAAGVRWDPAAIPFARPLAATGVEDRVQVSEFPPSLAFEEQARPALPADLPPRVWDGYHIGILTATAPLEGGRRLKWTGRWRVDEKGTFVGNLPDELFDLAADPAEERDLLAAASPAPGDVAAAARLATIARDAVGPR